MCEIICKITISDSAYRLLVLNDASITQDMLDERNPSELPVEPGTIAFYAYAQKTPENNSYQIFVVFDIETRAWERQRRQPNSDMFFFALALVNRESAFNYCESRNIDEVMHQIQPLIEDEISEIFRNQGDENDNRMPGM